MSKRVVRDTKVSSRLDGSFLFYFWFLLFESLVGHLEWEVGSGLGLDWIGQEMKWESWGGSRPGVRQSVAGSRFIYSLLYFIYFIHILSF